MHIKKKKNTAKVRAVAPYVKREKPKSEIEIRLVQEKKYVKYFFFF